MISKNSKIRPYAGSPMQGGKWTAYQVLNRRRIGFENGYPIMANCGWVTVIAEGNHPCEPKSGAQFQIKEITGVELEEWPKGSGKYKTTIWANIEWPKRENRNDSHLEDDIPEDF